MLQFSFIFILWLPLIHYHITPSSGEIRHNGLIEEEMEKQREGRIRGEKATDATCLSPRYPDYWKMRSRREEAVCQFIRNGRTEQRAGFVFVW